MFKISVKRVLSGLYFIPVMTSSLYWGTSHDAQAREAQLQTHNEISKHLVYYVLVDRFANGSKDNDFAQQGDPDASRHWPNTAEYGFPGEKIGNLSYDYDALGEPLDLAEWKKFWGGDLQGVEKALDHFRQLAVSTIYLSSPVKQSESMPYYIDQKGFQYPYTAYHGFWPKDLYRIDEHFAGPTRWEDTPVGKDGGVEGWEVVRKLKKTLEMEDIGLMVDAVINHSNPVNLGYSFSEESVGVLPAGFAGWGENGAVYKDRQFVSAAGEYFLNGRKIDYKDSEWFYNHRGSGNHAVNEMAFPGFGWSGLGDYNMTMKASVLQGARWEGWRTAIFDNSRPYEYVLEAYKRFIDEGFTAFRLDATKHVELPFLRRLSADLKAYAWDQWGKQIYLVGEWYGAGFPAEQFGGENSYKLDQGNIPYARFVDYVETNPTANIDFTLAWIIQEAFGQGHSFQNLAGYLRKKNEYFKKLGANLNANEQMIAYNNHDMPRFMQVAKYYGIHFSEDDAKRLQILATVFLLTSQGVPMLFYGDEIFLHVDNPDRDHDQDPYNRPMMPKTLSDLVSEDALISKQMNQISTLAKLRKNGTALAFGDTHIVYEATDQLCYERRHQDQTALICLNKSQNDVELSEINVSLDDGAYHNHISGPQTILVEGGKIVRKKLKAFEGFVISTK